MPATMRDLCDSCCCRTYGWQRSSAAECWAGVWKNIVPSIITATVNVRFLRFKRALTLALCVGAITVCLTTCLAVLIYYQTCATVISTVFLPYVDQQVGPTGVCEPVTTGTDGWLPSDWSASSHGSFSRAATSFYTRNLTNDWGLWPLAVNDSFDLVSLHTRVDPSSQSKFAPVPPNCTWDMSPEDPVTAEAPTQEPCLRKPSQALPRLGTVTWDVTAQVCVVCSVAAAAAY